MILTVGDVQPIHAPQLLLYGIGHGEQGTDMTVYPLFDGPSGGL